MYRVVVPKTLFVYQAKSVGGLFMNWCKKNGLLALVLSSMLVLALVVAGCGGGSKPAEPAKKDAPPVK